MKIKPNDQVLILTPDDKTYLLRIEQGKDFHTHKGILHFNDIIGKEFGDSISSSLDIKFILLEPTIEDKMMKVNRLTQIIYPKDAALIVLKAGIMPGNTVIECGVGSGALSISLANAVAPSGRLYTYDRRDRFLENAKRNIKESGFDQYVEFNEKDARDGFEQQDVDAVILDLPSPWDGIHSAYLALRGGGRIVSLSPTVNQVEEAVINLENEGFVFIETFETILRHYLVRPGKTRPIDRIVGHTGFLTVGRKANKQL
ncbi:MAG: tRNA (adenine-N1)-methyltransferase [Thermodesulfobacteriota bacterium]